MKTRDELHLDTGGAESGKNHAAKTVPYNPPKCLGGTKSQVTAEITARSQSTPVGPGPSAFEPGIDTVKTVARQMNPVERARQVNNRTRDMRTNLGRGKASVVETE